MKNLSFFFIIFIADISICQSQQFWESEFYSIEEKHYRDVLKNSKVKKIKTFYHYKKGAPAIPNKIYELDKNGNILIVIKKADQDVKYDVVVERNFYNKKGNLISHVALSNLGIDTMKFATYQYDSLNHLTQEIRKEADYQMGKNNKLERIYKNWIYNYENKYDASNRLSSQLERYNSNIILRAEFLYDSNGNLIEIKRFYKETQCLESWIQFSYYQDNFLKSKFYPNYQCKEGKGPSITINSNNYLYRYNALKQFEELERTKNDQTTGKIIYTYGSTGLLTYVEPTDDFDYYDTSLKYEFYK